MLYRKFLIRCRSRTLLFLLLRFGKRMSGRKRSFSVLFLRLRYGSLLRKLFGSLLLLRSRRFSALRFGLSRLLLVGRKFVGCRLGRKMSVVFLGLERMLLCWSRLRFGRIVLSLRL